MFERERTGGYELIYPSEESPEVNSKYELFIQKANELWDDFTTGSKGHHKPQKQVVVKSNTQLMTKKTMPAFKKAVTVVNPPARPVMQQTAGKAGESQYEMTVGGSSTTQSTRITSGDGKKKVEERQLSSSRAQMKVVSNPFDSNPYAAMAQTKGNFF